MPQLHVVIPVFNEGPTLAACMARVVRAPLPDGWSMRIVMIDDCSGPSHQRTTIDLADSLASDGVGIELLHHKVNRGKGAALQTGFDVLLHADDVAENDTVIIQDADLEYEPDDYATLLEPIARGETRVVVGTRWGPHTPLRTFKRKLHAAMNRFLTRLSNLMTGLRLTDMECCYKVMQVAVLREIRPALTEQRFGIEPQMIAALARIGEPIVERPVHYHPRSTDEGKKINWRDGVRALVVIARERFRKVHTEPGSKNHSG